MEGNAIAQFIPLILIFAIMYFLLIRPQQKKMKQHQNMVSALRRGDQVVTQGGLIGKVTKVKDDGNEIEVEIADGDPALAASRRERAAAMVKTLSPRQFEVTRMVAAGLLNKQIAAALGLSEKTIKMHRKLVMEKLELRTSADLIRVAVEAGI